MLQSDILAWAQVASAIITAVATAALFAVTWVLARETKRMAESGRPHVVATIEPNRWSLIHFDLRVAHAGKAPAYDVEVTFNPALPVELMQGVARAPLTNIAVLRPGQELSSYIAEYEKLKKIETFTVTVRWRLRHGGSQETNTYRLSMADYDGFITLGTSDPLTQIAGDLRKIREDWRSVAKGSRRLAVDSHTQRDRDAASAARQKWLEKQRAGRDGTTPSPPTAEDRDPTGG